jgi:ubiquinone/menaquinone biosynthesis C-methylase UbiE
MELIGVLFTACQMLERAWKATQALRLDNVEFRDGLLEDMPVETGWADAVISNGVINLCADKRAAFAEIWRVLRPGGRLQFADIANGRPVPEAARADIDLWTA